MDTKPRSSVVEKHPNQRGVIKLPLLKPVLHASSIDMHHLCPRKRFLYDRVGLRRAGYRSALFIGTIFHTVKAALYNGFPRDEVFKQSYNLFLRAEEQQHERCDKHGMIGNRTWTSFQEQLEKDFEVGRSMALYSWDEGRIDLSVFEPIAIEEEIIWTGWPKKTSVVSIRPDLLIRNVQTGDVWWPDHKTTSENPLDLIATLGWDAQNCLYTTILHKYIEKLWRVKADGVPFNFKGAMHNIIVKPTIRLKKDESPAEYGARVREWYKDETVDPKEPRTAHTWMEYPRNVMDANEEFALKALDVDVAGRRQPLVHNYPRNRPSCFLYHSTCEYLEICNAHPTAWKNLIADRYEISSRAHEDFESYDPNFSWMKE